MNILITGGAGFIGSHLAEALLNKSLNNKVYIIDNLSTGSLENLKYLKSKFSQNLFVYIDNILNYAKIRELVVQCDVVFHLAAAVGVKYILENPLKSIEVNIYGTENILKACCELKKNVLITSSSEVYGKHLHAPLIETDNVIYGPSSKSRWSYAASKLIDEFTALAYRKTKNLDVVIVRLFNTIGPRQTGAYGMVVPRFIEQALDNKQLTVYGDGNQTRTFTCVKDVVKALILLISNKNAVGEVFNIGGTEEISIINLAKKIIQKTNSKSEIKLIPYDEAFEKDFEDMHRRVPGIEKLKKTTGFEPKENLDNTLADIINYLKKKKLQK